MEFFTELRSVVRKVERGIQEINNVLNRDTSENDTDHHRLLLKLREKNKQMTDIKSEGLSLLTSLHQNHFLQTVAACEALYRKDLETLEKTEIYLKKYGYKPVEDDKQQENDNQTPDNIRGQSSSQDEDSIHNQNTPVEHAKQLPAVSVTPRMADYGISNMTMRMLSQKNYQKKQNSNSEITASSSSSSGVGVHSNDWSNKSLYHARENNSNLHYLHQHQTVIADEADCQQTCIGDTPEPPSLCTPGIKQLHSVQKQDNSVRSDHLSENPTPEPPVLMTPSLPPLTAKSDRPADLRMTTPEPPVLCTPGVKQIQKMQTNDERNDSKKTSSHFMHDFLSTPEPPEMTSNFGLMLHLEQHNSSLAGKPVSEMKNTLAAEDTVYLEHGESSADGSPSSNFLRSRAIPIQFDTPEAPDLTFSYKNFISNKRAVCPAADKVVDPTPAAPDSSDITSSLLTKLPTKPELKVDSEPLTPLIANGAANELSTPQLPELSGKYNFTENSMHETIHSLADDSTEEKENIPSDEPFTTHKNMPVPSGDIELCVFIPRISDEEYEEQPNYLKSLPQDKINQSIMQLNQLLARRLQAGEEPLLYVDDLQNSLNAFETRSIFLCLLKLKRLSQRYKEDGSTYYALC